MIKFVGDLRQLDGFLRVLRFPSSIKLTAMIQLKYCGVKHLQTNKQTLFNTDMRSYDTITIKKVLSNCLLQSLYIYILPCFRKQKKNNKSITLHLVFLYNFQFTSQIIGALENCTIATTSAIALTGSTMAELTQYITNCARSCQVITIY